MLDKTKIVDEFLVRKAESLRAKLEEAMASGDLELAVRLNRSLETLFSSLYSPDPKQNEPDGKRIGDMWEGD